MIIAFAIKVSRLANQLAARNGVPLFESNIIYGVLDEVKNQIIKLLPTTLETRVTGEVNVLQLFDIRGKSSKIVKVAGCRVSNGLVEKSRKARVLRNGRVIHNGTYYLPCNNDTLSLSPSLLPIHRITPDFADTETRRNGS